MKIFVFAHKPPHHGQSYMVQLLVDPLKGVGCEAVWRERYAKCGVDWILPPIEFPGEKTFFKLWPGWLAETSD